MNDAPDMRLPPNPSLDDEARVFEDILQNITDLPEGVKRVEFRLGEDHAGDRAVWFNFIAEDDLKPSKQKLLHYRRIMDEVREQVYRSGTDLWPYFRIRSG